LEFSRKSVPGIAAVMLLGLSFQPAHAQGQQQEPSTASKSLIDLNEGVTFEIAPHTGMMGGSGTFGLSLSMNYSSFNLELAGEQVIGKTANLYPLSVNAILNLTTRGRLIPYGVVGGGLLVTVPTNSIGDETVSTLGVNFGGGGRYYITKSFGVRLEVKQYVTSVRSERESNTELLFFQEFSVGVTFMLR
jgi:opacity protein-like surface antigen